MEKEVISLLPDDGSWGLELFDQVEKVQKILSENNNLIDEFHKGFKDIYKFQNEYSKKLSLKTSLFDAKKQTKSSVPLTTISAHISFANYLNEMGTLLHQNAKEGLDQIVQSFKTLVDSDRKNMESWKNKLSQVTTTSDQQQKKLETSWQKYVYSFKEKEKAHEAKTKADSDITLSRADQMKLTETFNAKKIAFDAARANYAEALTIYTDHQNEHNRSFVNCLEELDSGHRKSIIGMKDVLLKQVDLTQKLLNDMSNEQQKVRDAVMAIDSDKDAVSLMSKFKTGCQPPPKLPFLDLECCPPAVLEGPAYDLAAYMLCLDSAKSTPQLAHLVGNRTKPTKDDAINLRSAFICDLSTKPVKINALTATQAVDRLDQLKGMIEKSENEISGLTRLMDTYQKDSKLGDFTSVGPRMMIVRQRLQSLHRLVPEIKEHYKSVCGNNARPVSDAPVAQPANGFESDFDSDEDESPPQNSYVGEATTKYDYEGNGPDYLATNIGDLFFVTAFDTENSGWTMVVAKDGSRQGYVPTDYIDIQPY